MSLKIDNMLNLGSVIRVKGSQPLVMIIGYSPVDRDMIFDYKGCAYPFGVLNTKNNLVFNNDDIIEIIDKGYSNGTEIEFKEKHIKSLDSIKNIDKLREKINKFEELKKKYPETFLIKRLLPLGSIVKIKSDKNNKYMIISN